MEAGTTQVRGLRGLRMEGELSTIQGGHRYLDAVLMWPGQVPMGGRV